MIKKQNQIKIYKKQDQSTDQEYIDKEKKSHFRDVNIICSPMTPQVNLVSSNITPQKLDNNHKLADTINLVGINVNKEDVEA